MVGRKRKASKREARGRKGAGKPGKGAQSGTSGSPAPDGRELIDMKEAIAILKTSRPTFYRWLRSGKVKGMKVGRQWRFYREDIERFLAGQEPRIDAPAGMGSLIEILQTRLRSLGKGEIAELEAENDVARAVYLIFAVGVAMQASDIHLAASVKSGGDAAVGTLRCRVDGVLHEVAEFDSRLLPAIVERIKRLADCDVHEKSRPQDGRIMLRLGPGATGAVDMRVCFVPAVHGATVTLRILSRSAVILDLDRIDYTPADRARIDETLTQLSGLILVTGPTGCGKTTVLYCCLNRLARPGVKTMSIEDPVEFALPWVVQIPVRDAAGVTFPVALRSILRSDPDIIMVGEIRDRETLHISFQSAMTGHLVLSTLHAEHAAAALSRMIDIGSEPFLIIDTVRLVISQRLIRLLCPECSVEKEPPAEHLRRALELTAAGRLDWAALPKAFREPVGCPACRKTGYCGRTVIAETLLMWPNVAAALREGADADRIQEAAVAAGMTTMAADGIRRAAEGQTSLDEVFRVLGLR